MKKYCIVALTLLAVPALTFADPCNSQHPTPENPSVVLAVIGGAGLAWRSLRARFSK